MYARLSKEMTDKIDGRDHETRADAASKAVKIAQPPVE